MAGRVGPPVSALDMHSQVDPIFLHFLNSFLKLLQLFHFRIELMSKIAASTTTLFTFGSAFFISFFNLKIALARVL